MRRLCEQPRLATIWGSVLRYVTFLEFGSQRIGIDVITENEIVGEALVALQHDDLKQMGVTSVGHRLTILKNVYDVKVKQDIPIESDHYVPLCEHLPNPSHLASSTNPFQRRMQRPNMPLLLSTIFDSLWNNCGCGTRG
jgi:hypothetical protein